MTKPINFYYSSRSFPMPTETEAWIERLPVAQRISLASALLRQTESLMLPRGDRAALHLFPTNGDAS